MQFTKGKIAIAHITTCKSNVGNKQLQGGKFSNYSPIKEADEEGRYQNEESKDSSTTQKRRPSAGVEDSSSYETEQSASYQFSNKRSTSGQKRNQGIESSGKTDESSSADNKQIQQKLQKFMKNDYNVSISHSNKIKARGQEDSDEDQYDTSYNTTSQSNSANIAASLEKRLSNFEYLKQKYKIGMDGLDGVDDTDEEDDSSDEDTEKAESGRRK